MSQIKQLVSEDIDLDDYVDNHADPEFFPGELEDADRKYQLSKYSIEELSAEITRQIWEPAHKELEEAKRILDKMQGYDAERPF